MSSLEHCINELAMSNSRAAGWLETITHCSGTWDANWSVLEAAALLLSICVPKQISPAKGLELWEKYHDERTRARNSFSGEMGSGD